MSGNFGNVLEFYFAESIRTLVCAELFHFFVTSVVGLEGGGSEIYITIVTACVRLQEEEPPTAHHMSVTLGISYSR